MKANTCLRKMRTGLRPGPHAASDQPWKRPASSVPSDGGEHCSDREPSSSRNQTSKTLALAIQIEGSDGRVPNPDLGDAIRLTAKASRYHRAEAPKTASVPMQARKYSLSARWKNTSTLHVCAQFETGRDSSAGVRGDHGQILAEAELMGRYGRRAEQAA